MNHPYLSTVEGDITPTSVACRRWRDAEDLAYLVVVADNVSATTRTAAC